MSTVTWVLTHDLDFSALIALAGLSGPSVVHVRSQGILPSQIGTTVVAVLQAHQDSLAGTREGSPRVSVTAARE